MRIVFFGTPQFAIPTLERLLAESQFEVVGVVTQPDKNRGRGNKLSPSPIKEVATAHQVPIWQPARIKKDPETIEALRQLKADIFVVVAYGQKFSICPNRDVSMYMVRCCLSIAVRHRFNAA